MNQGITQINEPSDLSESIKELNSDERVPDSRMTAIDLKTRLTYFELNAVLALDGLVALGVLPSKCAKFGWQKKRLAVSLDGKGRQEIVQIVSGKREEEERKQVSTLSKFFGGANKNETNR